MTAVPASTPPADALAPTQRHHQRQWERGVLSLAASAAIALIWLSLDVPGLKLVMPAVARNKLETPVIATVDGARGIPEDRRSSRTGATSLPTPARTARRPRTFASATTVAVQAPSIEAAPAPGDPPAPPRQPTHVSAPSAALAAPQLSAPPVSTPSAAPASLPVDLPPSVIQVVTTAAAPSASDVTAATQQLTPALP